jgi:hypothetical protein
VACYNQLTLGKLLFNSKDVYSNMKKSGVYELMCDDCEMRYIGQTGRSFRTRMREHRRFYVERCFINYDNSSWIARHLNDEHHWCNFDPKVLHVHNKGRKLDFLGHFKIVNCPADFKLCDDHMSHFIHLSCTERYLPPLPSSWITSLTLIVYTKTFRSIPSPPPHLLVTSPSTLP